MAVSLKDGVLAFRHPVIKDSKGYGKSMQRGLKMFRLDEGGQEKIRQELEELIRLKPTHWLKGLPAGISREAYYCYFGDMVGEHWGRRYRQYQEATSVLKGIAKAKALGMKMVESAPETETENEPPLPPDALTHEEMAELGNRIEKLREEKLALLEAELVAGRTRISELERQVTELAAARTRISELERQVSELISTVANLSGNKTVEAASSALKPPKKVKV